MHRISSESDELGECPTWDERSARLLRIDVIGRKFLVCDAGGSESTVVALPGIPGSFAPRRGSGLLVAYRRRLALRDDTGREMDLVLPEEWDSGRERFNDGACDALGRFWVGTMDRWLQDQVGCLYRIDANLRVCRIVSGFGLSNGIAWSPDGTTMYHCDSRPPVIYSYDFDLGRGVIDNRRRFVEFTASMGIPDGCAMDAEGFLWVASPEAGQVLRFDPEGRLERRVDTPAGKPTSVGFGAANWRTLFVTSMRPHDRPAGEADGAVFACEAPAAGVTNHFFGA
jgi:L-arabinonolactonase